MKFIRLRYFFLFLLFYVLPSCQKNIQVGGQNSSAPYLHISFPCDVRSLDPRVGIDAPSCIAIKMLFEGLMRIGQDGKIEPGIAEHYEISTDSLTYTFYLRSAKWSNGDEVTAYDFAYSWKKIIDPKSGYNLGVQNLYPIQHAREIFKGELPIESVGIQVINDKILQVHLAYPAPYFLEMTASTSYYPIHSRIDKENPDWIHKSDHDFICNGPFLLESRKIENEIIVKKNPSYWDAQHILLPGIEIAIIKDMHTQLNLFEKNQLHWLGKPCTLIPLDALPHLKKQGILHFLETLGLHWYFINTEAFPFHNKKMRQAFALAVNRQLIIDHILQGEEKPACGILPHQIASQDTPFFKDHDIEKALCLFKEALDELGISKEELPEITINYTPLPVHLRIAETLQEQWNQIFGLHIKLEEREWKFHYEKLRKGNFQLGGMTWQSCLKDPIYLMQTFREKKDNGVNMSHWESKEFSALIDLAEKEPDLKKRKNLFNQAEKILMDEMPVIPLYFTTNIYAKSDRLKNVYVSELNEIDFRWATLK